MIEISVNRLGSGLELAGHDLPERVLPAFVGKLADFCFNSLYEHAPWRSGFLAMSITKTVEGNTATVGPTANYALYFQKGQRLMTFTQLTHVA